MMSYSWLMFVFGDFFGACLISVSAPLTQFYLWIERGEFHASSIQIISSFRRSDCISIRYSGPASIKKKSNSIQWNKIFWEDKFLDVNIDVSSTGYASVEDNSMTGS